jgi:hypothetical protein
MNEADPAAGAFRESPPPSSARADTGGLICKMCGKGTVARTKVRRMHWVGVVVGYLLFALPALWVILLIAQMFRPEPSNVLDGLGRSLDVSILICFGVVAASAGGVGWLLISKKEVQKCSHCGVEVPKSLIAG